MTKPPVSTLCSRSASCVNGARRRSPHGRSCCRASERNAWPAAPRSTSAPFFAPPGGELLHISGCFLSSPRLTVSSCHFVWSQRPSPRGRLWACLSSNFATWHDQGFRLFRS
eukprot:6203642-Pleurochrysis_carterae.AAC.1